MGPLQDWEFLGLVRVKCQTTLGLERLTVGKRGLKTEVPEIPVKGQRQK